MVNAGEKISIWYGEDLFNRGERDNDGKICVDVYAVYSYYEPYYYMNNVI